MAGFNVAESGCNTARTAWKATRLDGYFFHSNYDHITKQYNIASKGQEMVQFESDTISDSELKLEAIKAAIEYLKNNLKWIQQPMQY